MARPFTPSSDEIRQAVAATGSRWALIEGNKGLHDGIDVHGADSNATLAAELRAPVALVIDCRGMTRGIAPTVLGHAHFDARIQVAGAILNYVSGTRHEGKLRRALEAYTDVTVLGALPNDPEQTIEAPYLGLVPAAEEERTQRLVERLGHWAAEHLDLEALERIAATAPALQAHRTERRHEPATSPTEAAGGLSPEGLASPSPSAGTSREKATQREEENTPGLHRGGEPLRIGIVYDRAFNFYYPGDLEALAGSGAELRWIDTLRDGALPALDGLLIGGGFPERHAAALADNAELRAAIGRAATGGLPIYAECGGLLYLSRHLHTHSGSYPMAGALGLETEMTARPQGHGYVQLTPTPDAPWSPAACSPALAHEFHYSRPRGPPPQMPCAYRVETGRGLDGRGDGLIVANTVAGYAHLRHTRATPWVHHFLTFVERCASSVR